MKRKKKSSVRFVRRFLRSGPKKLVMYLLAVIVAAGTTHAMILPAMGVDVHELAGEADVGEAATTDAREVVDVDADVATDDETTTDAHTEADAGIAIDAGGHADEEVAAGSDVAEDVAMAENLETVANPANKTIADLEKQSVETNVEPSSAGESRDEKQYAGIYEEELYAGIWEEELYAETENFAVTVSCNTSDEPDTAGKYDGPERTAETEALLILAEAEESSEVFSAAKLALTELRREENESYEPDSENLAVLAMRLEDTDFADPMKINIRVRQVPDEISSEAFIQTAEIHRLEITEGIVNENDEDSGGFQTEGFRMEQGVLSADVNHALQANEPLSLVISWSAEEQEEAPDSGEFIRTAGTGIEDTTAIGISGGDSVDDKDETAEKATGEEDMSAETAADEEDMSAEESAGDDMVAEKAAKEPVMNEEAADVSETNEETADMLLASKAGRASDNESSEPDYGGYELPATGGNGRKPYRVAGGVLSAAALIALQITGPENKRIERRRKKGP